MVQQFKFIIGGFCVTADLDGSGDTTNACKAEWGGMWWGNSILGESSQGNYDWATGSFTAVAFDGLAQ